MFCSSLIYFSRFLSRFSSRFRFLQAMEIFKKGTAFRAFFKRPQKHGGHLVLCYIGLYTILQLQLVCARHHDLGKLIGSNNNENNNKFNDNELNNLQSEQQIHQQQQNVNAQIIHNQQSDPQPILKQQPILDQKITQQSPSDVDGPNGAVLSKDDGKYFFVHSSVSSLPSIIHWLFFCLTIWKFAVEAPLSPIKHHLHSLSCCMSSGN
jgi:hypothetical protein